MRFSAKDKLFLKCISQNDGPWISITRVKEGSMVDTSDTNLFLELVHNRTNQPDLVHLILLDRNMFQDIEPGKNYLIKELVGMMEKKENESVNNQR